MCPSACASREPLSCGVPRQDPEECRRPVSPPQRRQVWTCWAGRGPASLRLGRAPPGHLFAFCFDQCGRHGVLVIPRLFVASGCSSRLRLCGLNNEMCFSPSWRLGSPRPRGQQVRCPAGTRLLVWRQHLPAVPSRGRATGSELCVSSCEGTNPIHGGSILMPGSPPKPAPPNTIPPGGRAQHVTRGDQTLSPWHPHLGECGQLDKGNGQWLVGFATEGAPQGGRGASSVEGQLDTVPEGAAWPAAGVEGRPGTGPATPVCVCPWGT